MFIQALVVFFVFVFFKGGGGGGGARKIHDYSMSTLDFSMTEMSSLVDPKCHMQVIYNFCMK